MNDYVNVTLPRATGKEEDFVFVGLNGKGYTVRRGVTVSARGCREGAMDETDFLFFRGSTPTLELVLPLAVDWSDTVCLTLSQRGRTVVEYAMNGSANPRGSGTLTRDETQQNLLLLTLSEADTLALEAGDVELQLRLKNSVGADSFRPLTGRVGPILREGVLA